MAQKKHEWDGKEENEGQNALRNSANKTDEGQYKPSRHSNKKDAEKNREDLGDRGEDEGKNDANEE
ncbi:hypothetical protein [Albibacterium bauzanense]|uniref:Uncharacterized protein n=1 Tax=Albibacterium bauzanense TaxID=653929 RepID=A0A4R1LXK1_9SPHI|nr:hypothetical protein [Albibacterium bauzanense]TCK83587.1 hypothetical protein C8N28_2189 [Albibacterium bauzanense]